jgi:hypothetical protein
VTDLLGLGAAVAVFFVQRFLHPDPDATIPVRGLD